MRFYVEKAKSLGCGWNEVPLTDDDFHLLCRRFKIVVQELPLQVGGFYYSVLGRHFIAIDRKLESRQKLFVMFHEFAHFLLHTPESGATANFHGLGRKTRVELEADIFALCALMPRPWIEGRSMQELVEVDGMPEEMVVQRIRLLSRYGF